MLIKSIWMAGAIPFLFLGLLHLCYTFFTRKFSSRSQSLDAAMKVIPPVISPQTTMWKAWVGFNASHSVGAIYIGVINLIVAMGYPSLLHDTRFLLLNNITGIVYLLLSWKYWFAIPFAGLVFAESCFLFATVLLIAKT